MGLKKQLARGDNKVKAVFPEAYFRVMAVEMLESGASRIRVAAFADKEARILALDNTQSALTPAHQMRGPGDVGATIFERTYEATLQPAPAGDYTSLQEQTKASAYVYLKTHTDFINAIDC